MEPFTVLCSTCQSRIRVRNEGLIGQLVNCPKCSSLVFIAHPAEPTQSETGPPPVDSKAITRDNLESPEQSMADGPESLSDELRLMPEDEVSFQPFAENAGSHFSPGEQTVIAGSKPPPPPPNWNLPDRASPGQDWTSHGTNRRRQLLFVTAIGLTSILITAGLFVLFLQWADRPGTLAESGLAQRETQEPSTVKEGAPDLLPDGAEFGTSNSGQDLNSQPPESTRTEPAENGQPLENGQAQQTEAGHDVPSAPQPPALEGMPDPNPSVSALDDQDVTESAEEGVEQQETPDPLPGRLRELAQLIGQPFEFAVPQTLAVPDKAPVTAEELGIGVNLKDRALPPVDLHAASNERKIRGFRVDELPLAHAINYLSVASGLPIIVDATSMEIANANRSQKVSIRLDEGTVAECVEQFAQRVGLQVQSADNRFFRLYAAKPDPQLLGKQYNIGDLMKEQPDREWLHSYLSQFFPQLSASVGFEDSTLRLQPDQADLAELAAWFHFVRTLENWRMQRGLPSALSSYDPANLQVPFTMHSEVQGLRQVLSQVVVGPRSLAVLLTTLSAEVGLECWVDWPALSALGIEPNTLVSTVTFHRTLHGILKELSFEYGLVAAIIDKNTLWITSPQAYRAAPEIFVIPNQDRGTDYWEQFVRPLTPALETGVSKIELLLTVDGTYLFVKCCRPTIDFN